MYEVYDSMGRSTRKFLVASNIKEANKEMYEMYKRGEIQSAYGKVKRCWNGGVYGSR